MLRVQASKGLGRRTIMLVAAANLGTLPLDSCHLRLGSEDKVEYLLQMCRDSRSILFVILLG